MRTVMPTMADDRKFLVRKNIPPIVDMERKFSNKLIYTKQETWRADIRQRLFSHGRLDWSAENITDFANYRLGESIIQQG